MGTALADLRAALRSRLTDTVVPYRWADADLDAYINAGGNAMYPAIYVRVTDKTLTADGILTTFTVPAGIKKVALVWAGTTPAQVWNWRQQGTELIFTAAPAASVLTLIGYNKPAKLTATVAAWWDDENDDIPLCYAQALALGSEHSDRLDADTYSANFMDRAASPNQVLTSADFWMAQFRSQLSKHTMARISSTLRRS